jgi:hypothetical protein
MRVGVYNILIGLWYLLLLCCTTILSWFFFKNNTGGFSLIMIIPILSGIFALFLWGYFFYKFQIIFITSKKIISLKPFVLEFRIFDINKLKKIKWDYWKTARNEIFIYTKIINEDNTEIIISQAQFENFESLLETIYDNSNFEKSSKSIELYKLEAKEGYSSVIIYFCLFLILFMVLICIAINKSIHSPLYYGLVLVILFIAIRQFVRFRIFKLRIKK